MSALATIGTDAFLDLARPSGQNELMDPVSIYEAKNNLSRLIEAALSGEEVILTKRGQPVAKIVRIDPTYSGRALARWLESNPPYAPRSREDLDTMIDQLREEWD